MSTTPVQASPPIPKTTFKLEELAYRWFLRDTGCTTILNPDGSIPESVKESVGYKAFVDVFHYVQPVNVRSYKESLTPEQITEYESHHLEATRRLSALRRI